MLRKLLSPSNSSSLVPELGNEILNELDSILASLFSRYSDTLDCDQFVLTYQYSDTLDCDQFVLIQKLPNVSMYHCFL